MVSIISKTFFEGHLRQLEIDNEQYHYLQSPEYNFNRTYNRADKPKIPFKTHRVWVTDPHNPRELVDVFTDQNLRN